MPLNGTVSFVQGCKDYFGMTSSAGLVEEFKALTHQDKVELRDGLIAEGYDIAPLGEAQVATPALVGV